MKILLSNDDGYQAPGLAALASRLDVLADRLDVVAPESDRSGASSSLTLKKPVTVKKASNGFYYATGNPADCVHIATTALLESPPDIVVSGINSGANLGDDAIYSGTLAAAIEGRHMRYPPVSVSLVGRTHFETAARIAAELVGGLSPDTLPRGTVLNVNVPDRRFEDLEGIRLSRLGSRTEPGAAFPVESRSDDETESSWWVGKMGEVHDGAPDTDFGVVEAGYVSVTPIQIDMTRLDAFDAVQSLLKSVAL